MKKKIKYSFSKAKKFGLADIDNQLEQEVSKKFNSLHLTQDQVDGVLEFYGEQVQRLVEQLNGPKTDLHEEQKQLKKQWGDAYENNLRLTKVFAETMPKKMMENPIVDTAEGISLIFRLAKESNLVNFSKLN